MSCVLSQEPDSQMNNYCRKENATTETLQLMRLNFKSISSEFEILTDSVSKITLLLHENINGLLLLPHDGFLYIPHISLNSLKYILKINFKRE